jgi:hypothetical protein
VALNQTKRKVKIQVFSPNITDCKLKIESLIKSSVKLYPPRNNIAEILLNKTIEEYSPRKKNTNGTEECSVKKPATNSDSKIQNTTLEGKIKVIDYLIFLILYLFNNNLPDFKYIFTYSGLIKMK